MKRATVEFRTKRASTATGIITGTATSIEPDRMGDVVEPSGAIFSLPLPLLSQHNASAPIGQVVSANVRPDRIDIAAQLVNPDSVKSASLRDRLTQAWEELGSGLVKSLSIGFRPLKTKPLPNGGVRYASWEWLELSLVTIAANAAATIDSVQLAGSARESSPGVVMLSELDRARARIAREPHKVVTLSAHDRRRGSSTAIYLNSRRSLR